MSKQPQKAYWHKHKDEYRRHSVKNEVLRFMGWDTLLKLIRIAEDLPTSFDDNLVFADGLAIGFATAGRISEWIRLKSNNFFISDNYIEIKGMEVHKRYKKVEHSILCLNCKRENPKFQVICQNCGANLIYGGKRKWKTHSIQMVRKPFKFPIKEPIVPYIKRRLAYAKDRKYPYLFYNPDRNRPISAKCFYDHFVLAGEKIGLEMWPHRERAERCKQLVEEYGCTKDDLREFTMIVADATLNIYAGTSVPYEKKMGLI
jgi:hypothetical protein